MRIAALLTDGFTRQCLLWIAASAHEVVVSEDLRKEFQAVVQRKALVRTAEQAHVLRVIADRERIVCPDPNFTPICRDPDDDRVLACALAGRAAIILSGDLDLLVLNPFRGIRILTPRQFLNDFRAPNLVP